MKLKEIYKLVTEEGIKADPRGKAAILAELKKARDAYRKLPPREKREFDAEKLKHPYRDTRILYGKGDEEIKRALVGIDIDVGEILLADRLRERGQRIDLVISHHPQGRAYASFYEVMKMQADILGKLGVPANIARGMLSERMAEVARKVHPANHRRAVDAARLLKIPLLCVHTPADNHVAAYLQSLLNRKNPRTLAETVRILRSVPEYREATREGAGPRIILGEKDRRTGKIFVDMTGGTEGPRHIFPRLAQAGVGTIVAMHLSEEHFKNVKNEKINIIIAGHIASDSLGMNLLFNKLKKKTDLELISCSGLIRK